MKQGESYIRDTEDFLAKLKSPGEVRKVFPSLYLYFYGPHWNGIFKGAGYKTLVLKEIYWRHFFIRA